MTERYYERVYDEEYYILDSNVISPEAFDERLEYDGYRAFEDVMSGAEIVRLLNENEQLKQFQDRVFSWIDMHLQRLPILRDDEFESDNEFADPSLYSGAIQILETMKRELKSDVE